MLKNKVDGVFVTVSVIAFLAMALELAVNAYGEFEPVNVAKAFGFGGLFLCFAPYGGHGVPTRRREENCFISGLICLGISALFWIAILFDYLWGVK